MTYSQINHAKVMGFLLLTSLIVLVGCNQQEVRKICNEYDHLKFVERVCYSKHNPNSTMDYRERWANSSFPRNETDVKFNEGDFTNGSDSKAGDAGVFIGHYAGNAQTAGDKSIYIGHSAGRRLTTGNSNVSEEIYIKNKVSSRIIYIGK